MPTIFQNETENMRKGKALKKTSRFYEESRRTEMKTVTEIKN